MAPQSPQPLGSKERSLFTQVVKNYENKQYKKGSFKIMPSCYFISLHLGRFQGSRPNTT